ncbi:hypothetical protein MAR_024076 [Mya arenaria]|uniref:RRM domain-containing protein n=1 Tax=Mya arenaria TaxID=6604 RepID=A0ABY7DUC1_MYAAR|nr:hypothetical protein MAR_024076 [Mya arenaria]
MAVRMFNTYSVFVGHIHPDTKRQQLKELFDACGEIIDIVILSKPETLYNYGFVRYSTPEAVLRAVGELSGWVLNSIPLVVDISKDTADRISREKSGIVRPKERRLGKTEPPRQSQGRLFVEDTMYLTRLQEACIAQNLEHNNTGQIQTGRFLESIERHRAERFPTVWGTIADNSGFKDISRRIFEKCISAGGVGGASYGEERQAEYMSALQTIMAEINSVLQQSNPVKTVGDSDNSNQAKDHNDQIPNQCDKNIKTANNSQEPVKCIDVIRDGLAKSQSPGSVQDQTVPRTKSASEMVGGSGTVFKPDEIGQSRQISATGCSDLENSYARQKLRSEEVKSASFSSGTSSNSLRMTKETPHKHVENQAVMTNMVSEALDVSDPAIVDFHVSPVRIDSERADIRAREKDHLENLFAKLSPKQPLDKTKCTSYDSNVPVKTESGYYVGIQNGQTERSDSRGSTTSEDSTEGNIIADSGVESDFLSNRSNLGARSKVPDDCIMASRAFQEERVAGGMSHGRRRFMPGGESQQLRPVPLEINMKVLGRGRSVNSVAEKTFSPIVGSQAKKNDRVTSAGRGWNNAGASSGLGYQWELTKGTTGNVII